MHISSALFSVGFDVIKQIIEQCVFLLIQPLPPPLLPFVAVGSVLPRRRQEYVNLGFCTLFDHTVVRCIPLLYCANVRHHFILPAPWRLRSSSSVHGLCCFFPCKRLVKRQQLSYPLPQQNDKLMTYLVFFVNDFRQPPPGRIDENNDSYERFITDGQNMFRKLRRLRFGTKQIHVFPVIPFVGAYNCRSKSGAI